MTDVLDMHTHTLASGHAYNTVMEMAAAAKDKGLELLGITEHAPMMPGSCHEYYFSNLKAVPRNICGIRLMLGVELNICGRNGEVDLPPDILREMDLCIASMHTPCYQPGQRLRTPGHIVWLWRIPAFILSAIPMTDECRWIMRNWPEERRRSMCCWN